MLGVVAVSFLLVQPPTPQSIPWVIHAAAPSGSRGSLPLLPPRADRAPGNAAVGYLRAIATRPPNPAEAREARQERELLTRWDRLALADLPLAEMTPALDRFKNLFAELDEAARCQDCDGAQLATIRPDRLDGSITLLRHHQELGLLLGLRVRQELIAKRPEAALSALQTQFQHARDLARGTGSLQNLMAILLLHGVLDRLEDWPQQPGSRNLYWSIVQLPQGLVPLESMIAADAAFATGMIPHAAALARGPMAEALAVESFDGTLARLGKLTEDAGLAFNLQELRTPVGRAAFIKSHDAAARKELRERGIDPDTVEAMPAAQRVLLRAFLRQRTLWEEQVALLYLPGHQAVTRFPALVAEQQRTKTAYRDDVFFQMLSIVYPNLEKVHQERLRWERRLAFLRTVEALRAYATEHNGEWPATLSDPGLLPLPTDPATNQLFVYARDGGRARLLATPPLQESPTQFNTWERILTLAR
ncbi:MAG: hypothetical protein ACRCZF_10595 [Gemmataceae bacterium]